LSASAIGRLKDGWLDDHTAWQRRDLSAKRYVYIWADGIHLQTRLEDEKLHLGADWRNDGKAARSWSASPMAPAITREQRCWVQISCNARLALGCWLFGSLASTFAVLRESAQ
jgi:hypothetical protein